MFLQVLFQVLYTTIFGMYSTGIFLATRSIASCIVVHAMCNAFGLPFHPAMLHSRWSRIWIIASIGSVVVFSFTTKPFLRSELFKPLTSANWDKFQELSHLLVPTDVMLGTIASSRFTGQGQFVWESLSLIECFISQHNPLFFSCHKHWKVRSFIVSLEEIKAAYDAKLWTVISAVQWNMVMQVLLSCNINSC